MRKVILAVALWMALSGAALALPGEVGTPAPQVEIKDIFGKTLDMGQLKDWVVVVSFGNIDNRHTPIGWLKNIRMATAERENILFIIVADMRKFRFLKMMATGVAQDGYNEEVAALDKDIQERNLKIPGSVRDYFLLVTDWSASLFKGYGIEKETNKPHLFVVDGEGKIRGHFTEADTPEAMSDLTKVVFTEMDARKAMAGSLRFGKAKKNYLSMLILPTLVLVGPALLMK